MKKAPYLITLIAGFALAIIPMSLQAEDAKADGDKKGSGFIGKITAVDAAAKTFSIEQKKGENPMTFTMTETTSVVGEDGKDVEVTTLTVGSKVRVVADEEAAGVAKRVKMVAKKAKGDKDDAAE